MKKIAFIFLFIIPFSVYAYWHSDLTIKGYYKVINTSNHINNNEDSCQITGHVYSAQDKSFVPYAWVKIKGTQIGVSTDSSGNYSLKIPWGKYKLIAGSGSNLELTTRFIKLYQGKSLEVNFYLGSNIIQD